MEIIRLHRLMEERRCLHRTEERGHVSVVGVVRDADEAGVIEYVPAEQLEIAESEIGMVLEAGIACEVLAEVGLRLERILGDGSGRPTCAEERRVVLPDDVYPD